jgi:hypothetical protein
VLDAISAYQHEYGRAKLIERLTQLLLIKRRSRAMRTVPSARSIDIVCTTNFDFLLKRQYDAIPRYVYPVIDEEQLDQRRPPATGLSSMAICAIRADWS